MSESTSTEPSREESYLEWRQRLADRQAAWRQPDESAPTVSSEWDPAALFVKEAPAPAPVDDAGSQTIDLRADPLAPGTPPQARPTVRPKHTPPAARTTQTGPSTRPAATSNPPRRAKANPPEPPTRSAADPKQGTPKARVAPAEPEPLDRQAQFDSVMARLERRAARPVPKKKKAPPIADALRELNQRRIDGLITDDEFKARKAELFERSSTP